MKHLWLGFSVMVLAAALGVWFLVARSASGRIIELPVPKGWYAWASKDRIVVVSRGDSGPWAAEYDLYGRRISARYSLGHGVDDATRLALSPDGAWLVWAADGGDEGTESLHQALRLSSGRCERWRGPSDVAFAWMDDRRLVEVSGDARVTRVTIRAVNPPRVLSTWVIPGIGELYGHCQVVDARWLIGESLSRVRPVKVDLVNHHAPLLWYPPPLRVALDFGSPERKNRVAWLVPTSPFSASYQLWLSRADGAGMRHVTGGVDLLINTDMFQFVGKRGGPEIPFIRWRPGTDEVAYLGLRHLYLIRLRAGDLAPAR